MVDTRDLLQNFLQTSWNDDLLICWYCMQYQCPRVNRSSHPHSYLELPLSREQPLAMCVKTECKVKTPSLCTVLELNLLELNRASLLLSMLQKLSDVAFQEGLSNFMLLFCFSF